MQPLQTTTNNSINVFISALSVSLSLFNFHGQLNKSPLRHTHSRAVLMYAYMCMCVVISNVSLPISQPVFLIKYIFIWVWKLSTCVHAILANKISTNHQSPKKNNEWMNEWWMAQALTQSAAVWNNQRKSLIALEAKRKKKYNKITWS